MAAGELALMISIGARDGASSVMAGIGMAASKLASGDVLGAVATAGVAAGAALVGVGVASVKAAGDFQQNMTMLSTSAGESAKNLGMVGDGIKKIAVDTGTSTDQLSKAMYLIESSGQHGADGLKVLGVAAQGAKTENADLGVVANALTAVLTNYHMSADKSTSAMDGLIKAVSNGKTNLRDMSAAMGAVLPVAASLHISFPEVAGAVSTLTNATVPAQQAAQNLAHVLVALSAPSAVAVKSMKEVGLSAQEVKDTLVNQGLPQALTLIEDHVGKKFPAGSVEATTALKNIMGGLVGFKLAAALTGDSLKEYQKNVDSTAAAMNSAGKDVSGFDLVQQNLNFQIDRAKAAFEVLSINLGQKLLPLLTPLIKGFVDLLSSINGLMSGMTSGEKAVDGLNAVLGNLGGAFKYVGEFIAAFNKEINGPTSESLGLLAGGFQAIGDTILHILIPAFKLVSDIIGSAFIGLFGSAAKAVDTLDSAIAVFSGITDELYKAIVLLDGPIAFLANILKTVLAIAFDVVGGIIRTIFIPALIGIGVALVVATGPLGMAITAIVALSAAVDLAYKNIKPFHDAVDAIGGLLTNVGKTISDLAKSIASALQPALDAVARAFKSAGDALSSLAASFAKSKDAINLVIAALIGLSIALLMAAMPAIITFVSTAIPAIVTGLILWAANLVIVLIGTLAVAAPYILIGLVVAAVIFAILEVITHWGEITKWLQQKWEDFAKGYQTLMQNIQKWDESVRKSIQDGWTSTMKWMSDNNSRNNAQADKDWATFAKTVQKWGDASDKSLEDAFNRMTQSGDKSTKQIADAFKWLYDHNIYIKALCDAITKDFDDASTKIQASWAKTSKYLTDTWTQNNQDATKQWQELGNSIQSNDDKARKGLEDGWAATSKFLSDNWSKNSQTEDKTFSQMAASIQKWGDASDRSIEQTFSKMLQSFAQWGQNSDKAIEDTLNTMGRSIAGFWGNTVQPALGALGQHWNDFWQGIAQGASKIGENIMKAIASGIAQGGSAIATAVHNAISQALSGLGFINIPGFAQGVTNFQPPGSGGAGFALVGENGPELIALPRGASVIPSGPTSSLVNSSTTTGGSGQPMTIIMMLDGRQIGKVVTNYQAGELRVAGNVRNR